MRIVEKKTPIFSENHLMTQERQIFTLPSPISFLPKQQLALDSIKKHKFTVYSGAVAAGKTLLLAHAAIRTCINTPNVVGIIGSLTYTQLANVVFQVTKQELGKYQDLLNKNGIPVELASNIVESFGKMRIEFFNGSIIYFLAMDEEEKIRGYTIDFCCLDEPIDIDETIFKQLMARMRGQNLQHRFMLLTTNPGPETHWIYQRFYKNSTPDYCHIDTNSYENIFLPEGYITPMESSYDSDWIRRFLRGEWGAFSGQIYKAFDTNKHVIEASKYEPKIRYYIAGVDWGITNPSCILTIGICEDKTAVIVDEYYKADVISTKVALEIKKKDKVYSYRKVFVDPSAHDLISQCEELHIPVEKADNHVEAGIGKVKSLIERDQILVDRKCRNLINELQSYRFDKDKTNLNKTEKPLKVCDHACDALRYGIFSFKLYKQKINWTYIPNLMDVEVY
jgi:PBSX family phage terminase large subunit